MPTVWKKTMKPDQIYQHLKEIAEKLQIEVVEQSFRGTGIRVQSGFCRVRDQMKYIMDRSATLSEKNRYLSECLAQMPIDDIYMVPVVREMIQKYAKKKGTEVEAKKTEEQETENTEGHSEGSPEEGPQADLTEPQE